jgi:hypothetical protein
LIPYSLGGVVLFRQQGIAANRKVLVSVSRIEIAIATTSLLATILFSDNPKVQKKP